MTLEMVSLIHQLSVGLDFVEATLFGIKTKHGKRLALLVSEMALVSNLTENEILTLSMLAPLHDNALTEYIAAELHGDKENLYKHCIIGQENIEKLRFPSSVKDIVRYHHEYPDKSGCFKKKEGEISFEAEILSLADYVDLKFGLGHLPEREIPVVIDFVNENRGKLFFQRAADIFVKIFDKKLLRKLSHNNIDDAFDKSHSELFWYVDLDNRDLLNLAIFVMKMIDYKSKFTLKHSSQIANRIWIMLKYYNYGINDAVKMYLVAAFHDLGKLVIPTNILDKEGTLTGDELKIIKSHALWTYNLLKEVKGFEEICYLASAHHERLDGNGYPFGKKAGELNFFARLLGVIDIYQAVSEVRPYHPQRSHEETMPIIFDMAQKGLLDQFIANDIDIVMKPYSLKDVPNPGEFKLLNSY